MRLPVRVLWTSTRSLTSASRSLSALAMSTRFIVSRSINLLGRRCDQVVTLESIHFPHGEAVGLQRLARQVDLMVQRGLCRPAGSPCRLASSVLAEASPAHRSRSRCEDGRRPAAAPPQPCAGSCSQGRAPAGSRARWDVRCWRGLPGGRALSRSLKSSLCRVCHSCSKRTQNEL